MMKAVPVLVAAAALLSSCAYYNTFYLARKYYFKATSGQPYEVDRVGMAQAPNYMKSIEYCKKVIGQYPKSKWVDDALLLWARSQIGRDDPLQTITMLQDFATRFPKSDQRAEAEFYLGLAYRNAHRHTQAVEAFDEFLTMAPRNALVPYAHLERARALVSLERYADAAEAAGHILERFPHSDLVDKARLQRAEARFKSGDFDGARADYHVIGRVAPSDAERFQFLMREADCLESARHYDDELQLLRDELSHTAPPVTAATGSGASTQALVQQGGVRQAANSSAYVASDAYGRLSLRIGTAQLLAGRLQEALDEYARVIKQYPKTMLSAEAQYQVGYAYETAADDFDRAVKEYAKVKDQGGLTQFAQQAQTRSDDIGRITQFRHGAGADSLEKRAEAGFLTAERYLFELKRPDRALQEYAAVVAAYPGTPVAGRALNAQAWVLSRKMQRRAAADSLFWKVVREYPATEAQVAARDYLEQDGETVPDTLIHLPPPPKPTAADSARALTPPPASTPRLGEAAKGAARPDTSFAIPSPRQGDPRFQIEGARGDAPGGMPSPGAPMFGDSTRSAPRGLFAPPPAPPPAAPPVPPPAGAPADTTREGRKR